MPTTSNKFPMAPELQIQSWFNTPSPIALAELRGKVVVIEAFQMLCPGCVSHGLPQALAIAETFSQDQVKVLGLHSVFEHHQAMQPHALKAFLHEYRIHFPVGVDMPAEDDQGHVPKTMQAYQLRGTPSLLIIDRAGRLRGNHFGQMSDMQVAAAISALVFESSGTTDAADAETMATKETDCTTEGCTV